MSQETGALYNAEGTCSVQPQASAASANCHRSQESRDFSYCHTSIKVQAPDIINIIQCTLHISDGITDSQSAMWHALLSSLIKALT